MQAAGPIICQSYSFNESVTVCTDLTGSQNSFRRICIKYADVEFNNK